jgi:tRNA-Thr(GGU) m(6)t(6)A37 methyltransferase TsaA
MVALEPIGVVRHDAESVPRHWSVSELCGRLELDPRWAEGLRDIQAGERIVVLFHFDRSPEFNAAQHLLQTPPTRDHPRGVFSTCSPVRPNPLGMSVVEVLAKDGATLEVRGLDMLDGTPILDLKPHK